MTRDDILRWARSAIRLSADDASLMGFDQEATILDRYEFLHWFASNVATDVRKEEREECARMIEGAPPLVPFAQNDQGVCLVCGFTPKLAAAAIRARSNVQQEPQK